MKTIGGILLGSMLAAAAIAGGSKAFDGAGIANMVVGESTIEDATRLLGRAPDSSIAGQLGGTAYTWQDGPKVAALVFDKSGNFARVLTTAGITLDTSGKVAAAEPRPERGSVPARHDVARCVAAMEHATVAQLGDHLEAMRAERRAVECQTDLLQATTDDAYMRVLLDAMLAFQTAIQNRYSPSAKAALTDAGQALLGALDARD